MVNAPKAVRVPNRRISPRVGTRAAEVGGAGMMTSRIGEQSSAVEGANDAWLPFGEWRMVAGADKIVLVPNTFILAIQDQLYLMVLGKMKVSMHGGQCYLGPSHGSPPWSQAG